MRAYPDCSLIYRGMSGVSAKEEGVGGLTLHSAGANSSSKDQPGQRLSWSQSVLTYYAVYRMYNALQVGKVLLRHRILGVR